MVHARAATSGPADDMTRLDALAGMARDGDHEALVRLLDLVHPMITQYCSRRLDTGSSLHSPEDVAQEILLALVGSLPSFRHGSSSFLPFMYGIASRKVSDAYRSMATYRRYLVLVDDLPDTPDPTSGPEASVLRAELTGTLRRRMQHLPHTQQTVLMLRVVAGYSAPEAAQELGTTAGAVRIMQHRALTTLRSGTRVCANAS